MTGWALTVLNYRQLQEELKPKMKYSSVNMKKVRNLRYLQEGEFGTGNCPRGNPAYMDGHAKP